VSAPIPIRLEGVQPGLASLIRSLGYEPVEDSKSAAILVLGSEVTNEPLAERIRALRADAPAGPLLIVGPSWEAREVVASVRAGADDWLAPPINAERLGAALEALRERHQVRAQSRELVSHLESQGKDVAAERAHMHARVRELAHALQRKNEELTAAHGELRSRIDQLGMLYRIGRVLSFERNWDQALATLMEKLCDFLDAEGVALLLYSQQGQRLATRSASRLTPEHLREVGDLLQSGERQWEADATLIALGTAAADAPRPCAERDRPWNETILPLRHRDTPLGHLLLAKPYRDSDEFERDRFFLVTLQSILAEEVAAAQAMGELRALQRFQERMLDHVDSAVLSLDAEGAIRYANRTARRLLPGDQLHAAARQVVVGAERLPLGEWIAELEGGAHRVSEGWVRSDDGGDAVPVSLWACALPGEFPGDQPVLVLAEDLRERHALEVERRRAARQDELLIMAAEWAHDVRTPLTGILHSSELLLDSLPARATSRRHFDVIRNEVRRINDLVSNFLDFARPARLKRIRCDMLELCEASAQLLRRVAERKRIELVVDAGDEELPEALLDGDQLKQVVLNLITNAIDAAPDGSHVTIGLESRSPTADASNPALEEFGCIVLTVSDEGPGVPEENIDRLFVPFFTTKPEGSGLGLAICDKIARAHHGHLRYQRMRRQTQFELVLPILERAGATTSVAGPAQREARG